MFKFKLYWLQWCADFSSSFLLKCSPIFGSKQWIGTNWYQKAWKTTSSFVCISSVIITHQRACPLSNPLHHTGLLCYKWIWSTSRTWLTHTLQHVHFTLHRPISSLAAVSPHFFCHRLKTHLFPRTLAIQLEYNVVLKGGLADRKPTQQHSVSCWSHLQYKV